MNNKKLDKLIKNIKRDIKESERASSENYQIQKNVIEQLKDFNQLIADNDFKDNNLESLCDDIKDKLRLIKFDSEFELESEKEISKFDTEKITKDKIESIQKELEQKKWDEMYELLISFMKENYHCCLNVKEVYKNKPLGKWVDQQRKLYRKAPDSHKDNFKKLNTIKINDNIQVYKNAQISQNNDFSDIDYLFFEWSSSNANWARLFRQLKKFYSENKHSLVPSNFSTKCGNEKLELGTWVLRMRQIYRDGLLPQDRIDKLKTVYFCFSTDLNTIIKNETERDNLLRLIKELNKNNFS